MVVRKKRTGRVSYLPHYEWCSKLITIIIEIRRTFSRIAQGYLLMSIQFIHADLNGCLLWTNVVFMSLTNFLCCNLFFCISCLVNIMPNFMSNVADRKSTRLNTSHPSRSRMPSSAWKKKKKQNKQTNKKQTQLLQYCHPCCKKHTPTQIITAPTICP